MHVDVAEVAFEEIARLVGVQTTVRPDDGETDEVSVMVPLKPLRLERIIGDVAEDPAGKAIDAEVEIAKSTTFTCILTAWESGPTVPVTVRI